MIIIGSGGHARVIAEILKEQGIWNISFWVDQPSDSIVNEFSVFKREQQSIEEVIIGIGDNRIREKICKNNSYVFTTAIHPKAIISNYCEIGLGTVCMAGVILNTNSVVGKHVILNTGAVIDHDALIGDFVHISPNATLAGAVTVGEGSWIGAGATVIQGIKIGKWAIIGAGAVVIKDVPDFAVVVGNPARIIKYNKSE
ncbi:acetyltransferase [Flavihumibacter sp. UBA7668]|uniref:acetyltransferase n=1 Tax=Flavihumibacter sp. UBA7668 TaxID=1946542 RepID=UPI0025C3E6E1|nr:acetyltransferase [Flavihumibacter sp. UBA7668]